MRDSRFIPVIPTKLENEKYDFDSHIDVCMHIVRHIKKCTIYKKMIYIHTLYRKCSFVMYEIWSSLITDIPDVRTRNFESNQWLKVEYESNSLLEFIKIKVSHLYTARKIDLAVTIRNTVSIKCRRYSARGHRRVRAVVTCVVWA